ncbi:mitochondrial S-adenosylmethionine carrier protein isoform X2 [Syngnathus scovelli]|uniref:mitochondrial S-adenosylmethionine carrier protein isoform X2 n=1 Tax=Syngnathus scovelli TaxID=161590 RepID=UPI00210FE23D|nr:S-adenosylmethionine mitochondrial carrier protein isoform X2 [Syngnathus scovelli]
MESREFIASLVAGGCAGMCVDLTLFPLDTIKTRLQSQQGFYRAGGFRGIYAGVPSAALGSFPSAAAFFVTYDYTKSFLGSSGMLKDPSVASVTHMLAASLGETIPFSLVQFPLWEYLKTQWSQRRGHTLHSWQAALCGAFAGAVAALVTNPLDVAKTRIMLAKAGSTTASGNIPLVLCDVWKRQGLTGLFAGSIPRMTFISMGGFIFLGAYEKTRRTLLS